MHRFTLKNLRSLFLIFLLCYLGSFTSCLVPREFKYFTDIPDTIYNNKPFVVTPVQFTDPVIQKNDLLIISIQTTAQNESNAPINPITGTSTVATANSGILVDKNGNIEYALIGYVKVAGLTTLEAREVIKAKAKEFYKDPVVTVKFSNFEVTFLGEVSSPGSYSFPSEKVDIIEGLAAAHDLSIYGKRENILLIRNEDGLKKFVRFNMNNTEIFKSPYFYLRQRDVVYVEPHNFKIRQNDQTISRNVGIISGVLSLATLVLAFRNLKL